MVGKPESVEGSQNLSVQLLALPSSWDVATSPAHGAALPESCTQPCSSAGINLPDISQSWGLQAPC